MDPGGFGGASSGGAGGAFGGGKAGATQDLLTFVKRPTVIIRLFAWLFAIIVFGSISSQGWSWDSSLKKEVCILNQQSSVCHWATFVGVMAFLACFGFVAGEWFFEQFSSIKTRKHYVIADLGFSSLWAFFYLTVFILMCVAWSKTDKKYDSMSSNVIGAIFVTFCSIFTWAGSAYFAYQRFQAGADTAFTQGIGDDDLGEGQYPGGGYPGDGDDMQYSEPPFSGGGQSGMNYQPQMQY